MSTDPTKIYQAFLSVYGTLSPLPTTVYENQNYPDVNNGMFAAIRHLPSIPDYPELGNDAQSYERGFFMITIYDKQGNGWKAASDLAKRITDKFTRNTVMSYSDYSIKVKRSYKMQSDTENSVYQLPVLIEYDGYI